MCNAEDERRRYSRYRTEWPVFLRNGNERKIIGYVADISLSGVRMVFTEPEISVKDAEVFDLYLYARKFPADLVNISGRLVWNKESDGSITIGLEMEKINSETAVMLESYINNKEDLDLQIDLVL